MALATKGANCFSSGSGGHSVFKPADSHIFPEALDLVFLAFSGGFMLEKTTRFFN